MDEIWHIEFMGQSWHLAKFWGVQYNGPPCKIHKELELSLLEAESEGPTAPSLGASKKPIVPPP